MPYWIHSAPQDHQPGRSKDKPPGRRCALGERCGGARPGDDGQPLARWADHPSPFCRRDTTTVARALTGLTARYVHLRVTLGDKQVMDDTRVTMSRTPPVPLHLAKEALIRDMLWIMCGWEARVRAACQLSARPAGRRRDEVALPAAVRTLTPRLPDLLALPPAPVVRYLTSSQAALLPAGTGTVRKAGDGIAEIGLLLGGPDAGREILRLSSRAHYLLGETRPRPVELLGIPCKSCGLLVLEEAPEPEYKSVCRNCGNLLTAAEYKLHVERWAAWARIQETTPVLEPAGL